MFCLCTRLLAAVGVICHLGICLQEFSQGVLCVGNLHISYYMCGSIEMGTLRGCGSIGLFSPVICEHLHLMSRFRPQNEVNVADKVKASGMLDRKLVTFSVVMRKEIEVMV